VRFFLFRFVALYSTRQKNRVTAHPRNQLGKGGAQSRMGQATDAWFRFLFTQSQLAML